MKRSLGRCSDKKEPRHMSGLEESRLYETSITCVVWEWLEEVRAMRDKNMKSASSAYETIAKTITSVFWARGWRQQDDSGDQFTYTMMIGIVNFGRSSEEEELRYRLGQESLAY